MYICMPHAVCIGKFKFYMDIVENDILVLWIIIMYNKLYIFKGLFILKMFPFIRINIKNNVLMMMRRANCPILVFPNWSEEVTFKLLFPSMQRLQRNYNRTKSEKLRIVYVIQAIWHYFLTNF